MSISPVDVSIAETASLSVFSTNCTVLAGKLALSKPFCMHLANALEELIESDPPLSIAVLPDLMHRPPASIVTLGLDS